MFALSGSLDNYFQLSDFTFFIPTIFLFIVYLLVFKSKLSVISRKYRLLSIGILFLLSAFVFLGGTAISLIKGIPVENKFYNRNNNQPAFVSYHGLFPLWAYQIISYMYTDNKPITENEKNQINRFISDNNFGIANNLPQNKNLIIILVESLSTWVTKVEQGNATPFLTELANSDSVIYLPNILPQVNHGRSADAQLIINTGLLPVRNNTVANLYANQCYPSLIKELKNRDLFSMTIMGCKPAVWNQKTMNIAYGIDTLIHSQNLVADEIIGMGISDKSVFKQSVNIFKSLHERPFFAQIITLSSHDAIDFAHRKSRLILSETLPSETVNYIKSIEYVDEAIKLIFEELKKVDLLRNSIIVITGDHEGMFVEGVRDFFPECVNTFEDNTTTFTPLYIVNSDRAYKQAEGQVAGQIDIYPTLLDIMGLSDYRWRGVGTSIFSENPSTFAINKNFKVVGDTTNCSEAKIQHKKDAWNISDLIIRKKYFDTEQKLKINQ